MVRDRIMISLRFIEASEAAHADALATARQLEREGRLEEAELLADELLARDPALLSALLLRASLHAVRGERVSALACIRRMASERPGDPTIEYFVRSLGGGDFSAPWRGEVVELFDRYAPTFDEHLLGPLEYSGPEVIARALETHERASDTARVDELALDLGCGTGLLSPVLRSRARRVVGVDVSPAMVESARRKASYDEVFVADLVYALVTAPDETVDLLAAADVLGYLGDLRAVFVQARRVLSRAGRFVFTVEQHDGGAGFRLSARRRCSYEPRYLRSLASACRFDVVCCEEVALRREEGELVTGLVTILVPVADPA